MPDFSAIVTSPGAPSSLTWATWVDPPSVSPPAPSRLNAQPLAPPRYRRVQCPTGAGSITLAISAIVGGVTAPLDTALGGRLFSAVWSEPSGAAPPMLLATAGQSSLTLATFNASHAGHHTLSLRRPGGGALLLHLDLEN